MVIYCRKRRRRRCTLNDATLLDGVLVAQKRASDSDGAYATYDESPPDALDEWRSLAALRAGPRRHAMNCSSCRTPVVRVARNPQMTRSCDFSRRGYPQDCRERSLHRSPILVERTGRLSDERMRPVCTALNVAVNCGE